MEAVRWVDGFALNGTVILFLITEPNNRVISPAPRTDSLRHRVVALQNIGHNTSSAVFVRAIRGFSSVKFLHGDAVRVRL